MAEKKILYFDKYKDKFDALSKEEREFVVKTQNDYPRYWWNPFCTTKCIKHGRVHKFSFEAYVEGWVTGYFGVDSPEELVSTHPKNKEK